MSGEDKRTELIEAAGVKRGRHFGVLIAPREMDHHDHKRRHAEHDRKPRHFKPLPEQELSEQLRKHHYHNIRNVHELP